MNYYRRYIGDYMRDTASLSLAEHGAYNLLLDHAYATEKPIPGDLDEVMRLVRAFTEEERRAVEKVLSRYWVLSDDGYQNPRVAEEIEKAFHVIEKQKANGKLGGRPKKAKQEPNGNPTVIPSDNPNETQNNQPPTSNLQPNNKTSCASRMVGFEEFWKSYPKRKSRGQAEKAWAKIKPNEQLTARIIEAVRRATTSADWQKDGGQFVPYPATWLNAKGWEDEIAPGSQSLSLTSTGERRAAV